MLISSTCETYLVVVMHNHLSTKRQKSDRYSQGHVLLDAGVVEALTEGWRLVVVVNDTNCDVRRCCGLTLGVVCYFTSLQKHPILVTDKFKYSLE